MMHRHCLLQAHRGVSSDCPENTMAAYREAVRQGYDLIELDPKFTRDGHCVLLHDRTVNRTARDRDGHPPSVESRRIASLTYEEAAAYEYGGWFAPSFRGERLPLLSEVLAFAREECIPLKFDNVVQTFSAEERRRFYHEIERSGALPYVGFTASSLAYLDEVLEYFPTAQIHYDGLFDAEAKAYLSTHVPPDRLTIWLRYGNEKTAWSKLPPITPEAAVEAKCYGALGLWLLVTDEEYEDAITRFRADVIETNGKIKPRR